jgi:Protein of unknwon function (DUF3310)
MIDRTKPKFKTGDRVEVVGNTGSKGIGHHSFSIGTVGMIEGFYSGGISCPPAYEVNNNIASWIVEETDLKMAIELFTPKSESVDHPKHYNIGKFEVIDVLEDWKCGFNDGNAIKYLARFRHKGNPIDDVNKAIWYCQRLLRNLEQEKAC